MLKLIDVTKDYVTGGSTVSALRGVSLHFRKNEFVSILGASGCGKTTMLNIIGGLDHYTSGDLVISGKSTKHYKDRDWDVYRNHRIGFVFQSYNLIPHQTVLGNVEIALTIAGVSKEERRRRATEALEKVGLKAELHKRPNQLSGGQMQRVAIARALVNNPEILLADEPTGALDSVTSVQIMDLIREIAGERLVIMVTHNPELAEEYSSRIVRLSDGLVVSDSNPYDMDAADELFDELADSASEASEPLLAEDLTSPEPQGKVKPNKKEKAAMSFGTALGLSGRNLRAKKGRTAVTSIAGSIGIIGVSLVLALSNGFNNYILKTEEDMLSSSPVTAKVQTVDVSAIMAGMTNSTEMPDLSKLKDKVYVNSFLTNMAQGMMIENDLSDAYLDYVGNMPDSYYEEIMYSTGVKFVDNLYVKSPFLPESSANLPMLTLPYENMSLSSIKARYIDILQSDPEAEYATLAQYVTILGEVVNVMPGTSDFSKTDYADYVLSQYDVIAKSTPTGMPTNKNEAVLVIGSNNDMTDIALAQLGLMTQDEFLSVFEEFLGGDEDASPDLDKAYQTIGFDRLLETEYKLFNNDEAYTRNTASDAKYPFDYKMWKDNADTNYESVKITGILRLKDDLNNGCLKVGLNLTEKLVSDYVQVNMQTEFSEYVRNNPTVIPAENLYQYADAGTGTPKLKTRDALAAIGGSDNIMQISFYTRSFESKKNMLKYLDEWNELCEKGQKSLEKQELDGVPEEERQSSVTYVYKDKNGVSQTVYLSKETEVKYTDSIGMMMTMVEAMLDAITYVLVAFTSISLVVSSVMIGVITYVSVVERTKEIGVLRSLGARKKDIRHLFNAETFIIGMLAGLIGVGFTYLVSIPINLLLGDLTGITTLAALPIGNAVAMVAISVVLTLISGLVPASAAAKKDPVIALRTE